MTIFNKIEGEYELMLILLILLLAHLISDFWLQADSLPPKKIKQMVSHTFYLSLIHALALLVIWGCFYDFKNPLYYFILPLILLVMMHFVIDLCTSKRLYFGNNNWNRLFLFIPNQTAHFTTLLVICYFFFNITPTMLFNYVQQIFNNELEATYLNAPSVILFIIIIFIFATSVSGQVVKLLVGSLPSDFTTFEGDYTLKHKVASNQDQITGRESHYTEQYHYLTYSHSAPSRGKIIGYVERLLVILLTMAGAYSAIAFIVAAKSIARFKQLDDRNWAEYFLLGTLTSILLGVLIGLFSKQLFL